MLVYATQRVMQYQVVIFHQEVEKMGILAYLFLGLQVIQLIFIVHMLTVMATITMVKFIHLRQRKRMTQTPIQTRTRNLIQTQK